MSPLQARLAALATGAASVLAFAPFGLYPVELCAFGVLIHLWMSGAARAAFWTGFAYGLGLFLAGASWVYVSLSQFGGMPAPLAAVATLGFCVVLAAFTGFAGWLQARFPAGEAFRACALIPSSWTDRKSTRLNSSHIQKSRMPSSA